MCRAAGCILIGGETAELPGRRPRERARLRRHCVGIVDRANSSTATAASRATRRRLRVRAGCTRTGSRSRPLVGDGDFDAEVAARAAPPLSRRGPRVARTVQTSTRSRRHRRRHPRQLSRVLPEGVHAEIDWEAWERPPVFQWLAEQGVDEESAARLQPRHRDVRVCRERPPAHRDRDARVIGVLVSGTGTNLQALTPTAGRRRRETTGRRGALERAGCPNARSSSASTGPGQARRRNGPIGCTTRRRRTRRRQPNGHPTPRPRRSFRARYCPATSISGFGMADGEGCAGRRRGRGLRHSGRGRGGGSGRCGRRRSRSTAPTTALHASRRDGREARLASKCARSAENACRHSSPLAGEVGERSEPGEGALLESERFRNAPTRTSPRKWRGSAPCQYGKGKKTHER